MYEINVYLAPQVEIHIY